jgi:hypothetical protein
MEAKKDQMANSSSRYETQRRMPDRPLGGVKSSTLLGRHGSARAEEVRRIWEEAERAGR